ncbi:CRISPR-associated endoribonuclease Cas6 [Picrophilus oshimae]|uniref:CRISPR associated protein Cas6 C-terminal domain-containing protein n=1 Tax=Picrophilus torridus (strain ATCC 700027 / DSM 9790 / JCM 10055 / NBRC 100828 / KAW 2/3) TaxID=1122961 RepID=Q6L357_PICTO|nr:CRISPR-associated endoribonuclease Cas6 [Picrophilus oshimae]AAT42594.1 hypothetical protein PTO0009 [Picrophilus oshimae DSM 9789]
MKSAILKFRSENKQQIPFEHNYYLGIAIQKKYNQLMYSEKIEMHSGLQNNYTISSIITKDAEIRDDGIYTKNFFIVLRSLEDEFINRLKVSFSSYPEIRIGNSVFSIVEIKDTKRVDFSSDIYFKSLSPILIRYSKKLDNFVTQKNEIEPNLKAWMINAYYKNTGRKPETNFSIDIDKVKVKSVIVSKNRIKLRAPLIYGRFRSADPEMLEMFYYKGMGSKTGLGLGCWEAYQ